MSLSKIRIFSISNKLLTRCFTTNLPSDIQVIQQLTRKFADEELKPVAGLYDKNCKFPDEAIRKLGEMGFMGIGADAEFGGSNMNSLALSVVVEELSRGCASVGAIVSIHNCLYVNLLQRIGSRDQKLEFLKGFTDGKKIGAFALSEIDAGSDVASISTTATKDGDSYILNGTKAWVTSGEQAEAVIVFATVDKCKKHKGIAAFLVNMSQEGVVRGKNERKLGIRATSTNTIILNDVRVHSSSVLSSPGEGFRVAMEQLDQARIGIASQALGIAQASLDCAVEYAGQRIAFDSPIIKMSSVKKRLAEMALKIESSRLLVRQAATKKDEHLRSTKYTSMAKWHASTTATFCAHNCIQILGGIGVVEDYPAERFYRDARITEIYGGVTDVQMMIVAEQLEKEYFK
jgi:butyryl-CoA dehydrogenase